MNELKLKTGQNSFSRSIEPSDAKMSAYHSDNPSERMPIVIQEEGVLGQIAHAMSDKEYKKEKAKGGANPQVIETASIPVGCDRLVISYSLSVVPNSLESYSCDSAEVIESYRTVTKRYAEIGGYRYLAALYLYQILNGSFAWKNRFLCDDAKVTISVHNKSLSVDVFALEPLVTEKHDTVSAIIADLESAVIDTDHITIAEIIDLFAEALDGTTRLTRFFVEFDGAVEELTEVYPSQEYVRSSKQTSSKKERVSRILAGHMHNGKKIACLHNQKLGAAIRTIDIWNGERVVPINPYAGDHQTKAAYRDNTTSASLYKIMDEPSVHLKSLFEQDDVEKVSGDVHFMIACLIRGGVYSVA